MRIGAARWTKGRRLSADDLASLAAAEPGEPFSVIVIEPGELHEDDAALRLAAAVAGPNLIQRGPTQSRVDLLAEAPGVLNVRIADLERLNRIDPLEVFTAFDGQVVARGDLVASVKVAPHVVDAARVEEGARLAGFGSHPLVWVAPFIPSRVGVIVKESVRSSARERFEASVRAKVEGLGSTIESIAYVDDDPEAVEAAMAGFVRRPDPLELILTAGAASTDPLDACFVAITALGGRIVRRGVPAHPGSMLWLARIGGTADPRPADLRRLFQGDRRGPVAAPAPVRRGTDRERRSPSSATAGSSPAVSASASRPTLASWRHPTADPVAPWPRPSTGRDAAR